MNEDTRLQAVIDPRSIVVIGASENPGKIGGRPLAYMKRQGYAGRILAINPNRAEVQGVPSFPSLKDLPEVPELAYVAVAGEAAVRAVEECAALGVKAALIIAAGFGETGPEGKAVQDAMVRTAQAAGMRLIGPNSQGLANFGSGAISSFSTLFTEMPPADGPIAIVGQSGGMSQVAYGLLRARGLGVRHVHATGNECDVCVAEIALACVQDPAVRVLLLYLESVRRPDVLAQAAALARERGVPIVAVKGGRTVQGQQAATSHTGAMANEDRVVDAFFENHAIWRVRDIHEQVRCVEMYLKGWKPRGRRLAVISNSGASCVMAADFAADLDLPLAAFTPATHRGLLAALPGFAATANPVDVTAALLTNSGLFGAVLPVIQQDEGVDLVFIEIPVSGAAYDVPRFARDAATVSEQTGLPVAVSTWQEPAARVFREAGVPVFASTQEALGALAQLAGHAARLARPVSTWARAEPPRLEAGDRRGGFLSEARSLALLQAIDVPVVPHRVCATAEEARLAFERLGPIVVVKGCSADIPHKSEHGLVALKLASADAVGTEAARQIEAMRGMGVKSEGVVVARMASGRREFMVGARRDPVFGPVVVVGDGGKYVEALDDFVLLLPPFEPAMVIEKLQRLRVAPIFRGLRGDPPLDLEALAAIAVRVGRWMLFEPGEIESIDLNPVLVGAEGEGAVVVDALVQTQAPGATR